MVMLIDQIHLFQLEKKFLEVWPAFFNLPGPVAKDGYAQTSPTVNLIQF
jgi:hypothetical protein